MICTVCHHHCDLKEGQTGFCRARKMENGRIICSNYGQFTALALDPIEKKPLARFYPGSRILSVGSFGCNLRCPFCQNYEISQAGESVLETRYISPQELQDLAVRFRPQGNIGVAFTYNEPLISWEYIRDVGKRIHESGMKNVVVTNGNADLHILEQLWPYMDAMNIDLKCWNADIYREVLQGDLEMVKRVITEAAKHCHVELTTLIVPSMNDSEQEMEAEAKWIAALDPSIVLHVTRFFPQWKAAGLRPTAVKTVYHLADIAEKYLKYVYTGNC